MVLSLGEHPPLPIGTTPPRVVPLTKAPTHPFSPRGLTDARVRPAPPRLSPLCRPRHGRAHARPAAVAGPGRRPESAGQEAGPRAARRGGRPEGACGTRAAPGTGPETAGQ